MKALFSLHQVQQRYNGRLVLNIPSLTIQKGEILAIVGPSGAGKSTLLRLLNFLETPSSGHLVFDQQPVMPNISIKQRRRVTTVFQNPLLLKRSVSGNLRFGLALRGQHNNQVQIEQMLKRVGLSALANQTATKLSAGEAQRAALARALILRPDVLLLDEPTANLDPQNVAQIEQIIQAENHDRGTTIVIVTHNIFQARRISHRTALLVNGRLVEIAPTPDFFDSPQKEETAVFIRGDFVY